MMRSDDDRIFVGRWGDIDRAIRIGERIAFSRVMTNLATV
jgi:hypothetical protein